MALWAGTSPEVVHRQLDVALGIIHFLAGPVYAQILLSIRKVEWPILRGRAACRWSFLLVIGCRMLPLLAAGSTLIWLDRLYLGYKGTVLPVLAQSTQYISQGFALMLLNLFAVSTWQQNSVVRHGLQVVYLLVWAVIVTCIIRTPANGIALLPHVMLGLGIARTIFTGALAIVVFRSISKNRVLILQSHRARNRWSSALALFKSLRDEGFHYYAIVLMAQVPPLFVLKLANNPSGMLYLAVSFVCASTTTLISSIMFQRMVKTQTRCPVRHYCIVMSFLLRKFGFNPPSPDPAHNAYAMQPPSQPAGRDNAAEQCQWEKRSRVLEGPSRPSLFTDIGVELRTLNADIASTSTQGGTSAEGFKVKPTSALTW